MLLTILEHRHGQTTAVGAAQMRLAEWAGILARMDSVAQMAGHHERRATEDGEVCGPADLAAVGLAVVGSVAADSAGRRTNRHMSVSITGDFLEECACFA